MQLKSLEIQGFKSFPDKTRLEFGGGITAVVGPNGSGKSNLVDAVRWVFGEQSSKTLRGAKMEDVIFGGTQTRKPQGFASVTLTIDNSDRAMAVESDEISVTRRLYRSGESEYRLNGAAVRLKDIYELFMDTGLGRDGYSIIGQGKIAEIVSTKSRERREIFEEAAGISKYRYRKGEAQRRLDLAEENLLRLRDILSELEGRVEPLRRDSEKAQAFLELAEEKRTLEISVWMAGLDRLREQLREHEDRYLISKAQHDEIDGEIGAIEEQIAALYQEMQRAGVEMEELRTQIKEREDTLAKNEAQLAVSRNDIHHNEQTMAQLREEMASFALSADSIQAQLAEKERQLGERETAAQALRQRERELRDQADQAAGRERETAAQLEQAKARRAALYQNIDRAKVAGASSLSLLDETTSQIELRRGRSTLMGETRQRLAGELADCEELLHNIGDTLQGLENSRKGYEMKQASRKEKYDALAAQRAGLLDRARGLEQKAHLLEEMERNLEGYQNSVKYLLGQAKNGLLDGVHGPVSRLVSTDSRYATAIETALGGAMQNIVVRDEQVAKTAIRMLASSKQGRATFLPVTSVKGNPLREQGVEGCDGFVGLASSLVEYDPKFTGIVHWLLGRIVVAEDLDCAVAMAKQYSYRFRVVTLDGQVVNAGGSLTGGYTARSAGMLGRRHEIDSLMGEAGKTKDSAAALTGRMEQMEQELSALAAELWGIDSEMKNATEDKIRYEGEHKRLAMALDEAKKEQELAAAEEARLTGRLAQLREQNLSAADLLADLQGQLAQAETEIDGLSGQRDACAQASARLGEQLSQNSLELLGEEKDIQSARQQLEQLSLQQENQEQRREGHTQKLAELTQQNQAITGQIEELLSQSEALRQEIQHTTAAIGEKMAQRNQWEAETTALRVQSKEITGRKELVGRELARLEERKTTLQGDYDAIIARLWDEYEMTRSQAEEVAQRLEDPNRAQRRLAELKNKIKALGNVNVGAIEEYKEVSQRYAFMKAQVEDVEKSRTELGKLIGDLTGQMKELFLRNFQLINQNFSRIFTELFGGGKAHLALTDDSDVLESGIEIFVQPPGKVINNLSALSGGEQTFVAIAIYFAILKVNPAPFCLLDEIEAALDDVNVSKFAQYLRRMTGRTQFIAITHRRGTMEEADVLYGVTMQEEGVSKLLELKVSEVEQKLGIK